jgi:hypothetical protein
MHSFQLVPRDRLGVIRLRLSAAYIGSLIYVDRTSVNEGLGSRLGHVLSSTATGEDGLSAMNDGDALSRQVIMNCMEEQESAIMNSWIANDETLSQFDEEYRMIFAPSGCSFTLARSSATLNVTETNLNLRRFGGPVIARVATTASVIEFST